MDKIFHPAASRGTANHGWLNANFSFSFANYFDPNKTNFGLLRVLNDDYVKSGMGFGTHPHKDMEIISIPLQGAIRHKDSMDHTAVIEKGEVQVMSAGTGVEHSEFNSSTEELNMLQIWIFPDKNGHEPRYDQKNYSKQLETGELVTVVAPMNHEDDNALKIHQNAFLSIQKLETGRNIEYNLNDTANGVYVFLIDGQAEIDGTKLSRRDAVGIWNTTKLNLEVENKSTVLFIEVPMN
ncbi:pirin family protein [Christiangramia portivictoriae]|uniref:pirin family protein n=1 Tax=Christiangramia portivictoriae TaxID=326069 RepID=UPI0003F836E1|nr:pirin family protein [Christiangramia portivictoriae]